MVFGADHVYRMDPARWSRRTSSRGAGVTVAGIRVPKAQAKAFGVIETAADGLDIVAFLEKPDDPPTLPGRPEHLLRLDGQLRLLAPTC